MNSTKVPNESYIMQELHHAIFAKQEAKCIARLASRSDPTDGKCKNSFLQNEEGYRDDKKGKQEAAYPIHISLPPMPHCLVRYRDEVFCCCGKHGSYWLPFVSLVQ